ncbi:CBS domain-containing protein [Maritalea myrionectae]|uniref:CBS domain-containing protein n=1 Tax=Maritalea myrionectae TaxID=454601 RepID=UPI000411672F|nr:CBS domain-containing protein [Maritalea myrionectae]
MQAHDIMTPKVITVEPTTTVEEVSHLMIEHHVSALPVVDAEGTVLGIVSEGDLLRRVEGASDHKKSWWLRFFANTDDSVKEFVALRGRYAKDVMTKNVICVDPEMQVGEVARILAKNHIKRVPVVQDNKLQGIVSRANLMHALAAVPARSLKSVSTDVEKRDIILEALSAVPNLNVSHLNVIIDGDEVEIWGVAASNEEENAMKIALEGIDGVSKVNFNLGRLPGYAWAI